jgi:hypothetical protein
MADQRLKYTPQDSERARLLYANGATLAKVSAEIGCSLMTASRMVAGQRVVDQPPHSTTKFNGVTVQRLM